MILCSVAMCKASITLIVEVIVVLQLLPTGSSSRPACAKEGQMVTYECQIPAVLGTLNWNGVGFDCPSNSFVTNNVIALPTAPCPLPFANEFGAHTGECGPYFGNLTCTEDRQNLISVLEFEANYEMNGSNISCQFLNTNRIETFPVRVGVVPNQPLNVRVETLKDRSCLFEWTPPNESIGGIGGYAIHYGENCDRCTPDAGFVNQTKNLTAECIVCIECSFEVNTVSKDCSFGSPLVEASRSSVLMPCILETSNSTRINIHSTNGDIPLGVVSHNTTLYFSCDLNCTLDQNQTRCANGTFQPSISHILRDGCRCSDSFEDSQCNITAYILGTVGGIVLVVVVVLIIAGCIIYRKKNRQSVDLTVNPAGSGGKLEMSVID